MQKIRKSETELEDALATEEFATVDQVYTRILSEKVDIDVRLKHRAKVMHLKLEKELDIRKFIASVAYVENYKTILKSVKILGDKMSNAEKLDVQLDPELVEDINNCTSRLNSERNLRFKMDSMSVPSCNHDTVKELSELIDTADKTKVAEQYMEKANTLSTQMKGNIEAREILDLLAAYPEREYPEPEPLDAKGKPLKQKDDKKKVKKKKKKEPPFPVPDWAVELEAVQAQLKRIKDLVKNAQELHL